jgi:hypothetical protein
MTRPPMPPTGTPEWGDTVTSAVYDVSDRIDQETVARVNGDAAGGGGGSGGNVLVLGTTDPVPAGTKSGTLIARVAGVTPPPVTEIAVLSGAGNQTQDGASGSGGNFTVVVPTNRAVGHLVVLLLCSQSSVFSGTDWVLPGGWTIHRTTAVARWMSVASYPLTNSAAVSALGSSFQVTPHSSINGSRLAWAAFLIAGADLAAPFAGYGVTQTGPAGNTDMDILPFTATAQPIAQITCVESNTSAGVPVPTVTQPGLASVVGFNYQLPSSGAYTGIWSGWKRLTTTTVPTQHANTVQAASSVLAGFQFAFKQAA